MVINKAWGIKELTELARRENKCESLDNILDVANDSLTELILWIRSLQIKQKQMQILNIKCVSRYIADKGVIECGVADLPWQSESDLLAIPVKTELKRNGKCDDCKSLDRAVEKMEEAIKSGACVSRDYLQRIRF